MDIVWVLAVMMFAALVQSLGGFGFALMAVPLAALAIDLKVAVIAVSVGSLFNTVILFVRTRKDINRDVAWRFNVPAVLGMPIGLYVLANVAQRPLKIVLGAIIIVATLALMRGAANIAPRRWIEVLAGWLSGILSTATGTNGPPLVLAAQ
ncbi:MAG: TSUP family transporter, partial [Actinomycetota bacterium]